MSPVDFVQRNKYKIFILFYNFRKAANTLRESIKGV